MYHSQPTCFNFNAFPCFCPKLHAVSVFCMGGIALFISFAFLLSFIHQSFFSWFFALILSLVSQWWSCPRLIFWVGNSKDYYYSLNWLNILEPHLSTSNIILCCVIRPSEELLFIFHNTVVMLRMASISQYRQCDSLSCIIDIKISPFTARHYMICYIALNWQRALLHCSCS